MAHAEKYSTSTAGHTPSAGEPPAQFQVAPAACRLVVITRCAEASLDQKQSTSTL